MTVGAQESVSEGKSAEESQTRVRAEFRKSLTSAVKKRKHAHD